MHAVKCLPYGFNACGWRRWNARMCRRQAARVCLGAFKATNETKNARLSTTVRVLLLPASASARAPAGPPSAVVQRIGVSTRRVCLRMYRHNMHRVLIKRWFASSNWWKTPLASCRKFGEFGSLQYHLRLTSVSTLYIITSIIVPFDFTQSGACIGAAEAPSPPIHAEDDLILGLHYCG